MNVQAVANTILAQLGGNRFLAMTGARDLIALSTGGLKLRLPRNLQTTHGVQFVTISLMPNDTYTVICSRISHNMEHVLVSRDEGVYADNLRQLFTARTGLDTNL